jgi:hypothetical protein
MFENYELAPFFLMDLLIGVKAWFDSIMFLHFEEFTSYIN